MLTVEERAELVQAFEVVACMTKRVAGRGLDGALAVAIEREDKLRGFYEVLNRATDWGVPQQPESYPVIYEPGRVQLW